MVKIYNWNESIETGNAVIDLQHKQFFVVLKELGEALQQGEGAKELRKTLLFLKYYGEWHFGDEEKLCKDCPLANKNKDQHKQYMVTINALLKEIRDSGVSDELAHSSYENLANWLVNHIMKIDKNNADALLENRC